MYQNRIRSILARYDTAIWIRVIGTILTACANFMIRPFLALYLYDKLEDDLLLTTLIVALQPLTGLISGIFAGSFSDRYGRKPVMVAALFIEGIAVLGYVFAESVWMFALITIIHGIGGSLFFPAASAQVADVVPEERRSEVFALFHTALNLGAAFGPLAGVAIYKIDPRIAFFICAVALFAFMLLLIWKVPETLPVEARQKLRKSKGDTAAPSPVAPPPRMKFGEHKLLYGIVLACIPFTLLYTQVEVIFPQHLKTNFVDYLETFATLMTLNGIMVVTMQIPIARWAEKRSVARIIFIAYLFVALTSFGYAWSTAFWLLILSEFVFTLGEMMNGPQIQKAISVMAPPELRGRYFAIFGANWGITGTVGPVVGGLAFVHLGGTAWFAIIGVMIAVAAFVQYALIRRATETQPTPSIDVTPEKVQPIV